MTTHRDDVAGLVHCGFLLLGMWVWNKVHHSGQATAIINFISQMERLKQNSLAVLRCSLAQVCPRLCADKADASNGQARQDR